MGCIVAQPGEEIEIVRNFRIVPGARAVIASICDLTRRKENKESVRECVLLPAVVVFGLGEEVGRMADQKLRAVLRGEGHRKLALAGCKHTRETYGWNGHSRATHLEYVCAKMP